LETVLEEMKVSKSCKYLSSIFIGLDQPTLDKAKAAFEKDGGCVQLSDGRNTGSYGVPSSKIKDMHRPTVWFCDEVSHSSLMYACAIQTCAWCTK
jgi:hypothetical protein